MILLQQQPRPVQSIFNSDKQLANLEFAPQDGTNASLEQGEGPP